MRAACISMKRDRQIGRFSISFVPATNWKLWCITILFQVNIHCLTRWLIRLILIRFGRIWDLIKTLKFIVSPFLITIAFDHLLQLFRSFFKTPPAGVGEQSHLRQLNYLTFCNRHCFTDYSSSFVFEGFG